VPTRRFDEAGGTDEAADMFRVESHAN
jgi:hypothetical protein